MTVGGDRETHCGQELLVYHQGVRQGAGTCRQGLALQSIAGRSRVGSTPRGGTRSVQDLVKRLVRTHTNLQLEHRLELYEADILPWDLEMTVEESLSDDKDEDGVHHCVSDS